MSDNLTLVVVGVATALLTALGMWIVGWVNTFVKRRFRYTSPEAVAIEEMRKEMRRGLRGIQRRINAQEAIQDAAMDMQSVIVRALKASLEAEKGKINGNVDKALALIDAGETQLEGFYRSRARPYPQAKNTPIEVEEI